MSQVRGHRTYFGYQSSVATEIEGPRAVTVMRSEKKFTHPVLAQHMLIFRTRRKKRFFKEHISKKFEFIMRGDRPPPLSLSTRLLLLLLLKLLAKCWQYLCGTEDPHTYITQHTKWKQTMCNTIFVFLNVCFSKNVVVTKKVNGA